MFDDLEHGARVDLARNEGESVMQRVSRLLFLCCAITGSAVAQFAPSTPQDRPSAYADAQLQAMKKAIAPYVAQGKATYPQAKARFLAGLPAGEGFYVRATLHEPPNLEESVFIHVTSIEGDVLVGELNSQVQLLHGFHKGQVLRIPEGDVQDWVIPRPDGTEEGNVVGKFLDNYHPAAVE